MNKQLNYLEISKLKEDGASNKMIVFTLVERNGNVQSIPVERVTGKNLKGIIRENVDKESIMMTDEFASYRGLGKEYKEHHVINHSQKEYVRGDVHTNTAEGYFSLLKRGINGTFHHVGKQHLFRYVKEFDFKYNFRKLKDNERTVKAIKGIEGKRLIYRKNEKEEKEETRQRQTSLFVSPKNRRSSKRVIKNKTAAEEKEEK